MSSFFKNLNDKDFYSNKLNHIYLEGEINTKNIDKLFNNIRKINKDENPKPILIHINSTGGNLEDALRLMSIFNITTIPIATIIDNYSFSAATLLSINSPYRVMTKNSFCLLHEYRINGYINNGRNEVINIINKFDSYFKSFINMYLKKTLFTKDELMELLQHNLILDFKYCIKKGIVDRIINYNFKNKNKKNNNITEIIKNNNTYNLYISCDMLNENLDNEINKINNDKICLIYSTFSNCFNKKKDFKYDIKNIFYIFNSFNLITKIKTINTLKYSIIDIPISLENLLPLLYTDKIYMYSHTYIVCNFLYTFDNYSLFLDDNIKNTLLIINKIKKILKEKTKMKLSDINMINKKFMILNPIECKKLGLCHEIITI